MVSYACLRAVGYVASGGWESALHAFRDCGGEVAKVAGWELSDEKGGDFDAAKVARFWWAFAEGKSGQRKMADIVKAHARRRLVQEGRGDESYHWA